MTFGMPYSRVEWGLAMSHEVDTDRLSAFRSRLRNLQRIGVPPSIGQGRGRAVQYGAGDILQMALALELIQLGLTPERAAFVLTSNMDRIVLAVRIAASWRCEQEKKPAMFLWFDPAALTQIWIMAGNDRADQSFNYGGLPVLKEGLDRWAAAKSQSEYRRLALINLSNVIEEILAFTDASGFSNDVVTDALTEWADATEERLHGDDPQT